MLGPQLCHDHVISCELWRCGPTTHNSPSGLFVTEVATLVVIFIAFLFLKSRNLCMKKFMITIREKSLIL